MGVKLPTINKGSCHAERFTMARKLPAKRATRPNPRTDRHQRVETQTHQHEEVKFRKRVEIIPRSIAQEDYLECLVDKSYVVVVAMGPAGCGKTLLATEYAIKGLYSGQFRKVIITRPTVSVDESYGYLPGTLNEKLAPWMIPITDIFKTHFSVQQVEKMILNEIIEIAPLGFMRGRNLVDSVVLFDEAQNATPNQMKMMLTRISEGSKMIITGDLRQHDRGYEHNGLRDFVDRLRRKGSRAMAICEFSNKDIERHPIIEEVLNLYDE